MQPTQEPAPTDSDPEEPPPPVPVSGARTQGARTTIEVLSRSADVFEVFFDTARIGLALADLSGRYVRVNQTYAQLLGMPPEDFVGVGLADVVGEADASGLARLLSGQGADLQTEISHRRPDGLLTWLLHGITTVSTGDGGPGWFAVSAQDITERRQAELQLQATTDVLAEQAVRDPLTGLANRTLLEERLGTALARDARTGGSTAVLFLDLDGFKEVNDRYGHAVGDEVLRGVATRLTAVVRPSDTVARIGGDEFVVLIEAATDAGVEALLPRVQAAVCEPLLVDGTALPVGVSIGVALSAAGSGDPAGLLAAADTQMYDAKRAR